ncbi:hypothetical protein OS493_011464 [Desmophyllum pertusum]|uniref:Uncharacterized protein n=1 Tax=Desmophyllum pertusum TaxID=174260 RepID=A0A9W9YTJ7_9CNID|nr:hypothetical protein OS493_011464 [Desmophyllum pertusum]
MIAVKIYEKMPYDAAAELHGLLSRLYRRFRLTDNAAELCKFINFQKHTTTTANFMLNSHGDVAAELHGLLSRLYRRFRLTDNAAELLRALMMSDDIATLRSCHIHVALMGSKFDEEGKYV